mmetsp:Transcript_72098/g.105661  ORF Transcript_72098/g.105661 Transcript_72098/m.105661 type:complete len:219 (-) Transcript_72098:1289-1945(-)
MRTRRSCSACFAGSAAASFAASSPRPLSESESVEREASSSCANGKTTLGRAAWCRSSSRSTWDIKSSVRSCTVCRINSSCMLSLLASDRRCESLSSAFSSSSSVSIFSSSNALSKKVGRCAESLSNSSLHDTSAERKPTKSPAATSPNKGSLGHLIFPSSSLPSAAAARSHVTAACRTKVSSSWSAAKTDGSACATRPNASVRVAVLLFCPCSMDAPM